MRGFFTFSIAIFLATGSVSAKANQLYICERTPGDPTSGAISSDVSKFNACIEDAKKGEAQIYEVVNRKGYPLDRILINADYCEKNKKAESCRKYFNGDYAEYQKTNREIDKQKKEENQASDKKCREIYGPYAISDGNGGCKASKDDGLAKKSFEEALQAKQHACQKKVLFDGYPLYKLDEKTGECTENTEMTNRKKEKEKERAACQYPKMWTPENKTMDGSCKLRPEIEAAMKECPNKTPPHRWDDQKYECVKLSQGEQHKRQAEADKTKREGQKVALEELLKDEGAFEAQQKAYQERKRKIADLKRQEELAKKQEELQKKIKDNDTSSFERLRYEAESRAIDFELGPLTKRVTEYEVPVGNSNFIAFLETEESKDKEKYGEHAFDSADPEKARKSAESSVKAEEREMAQATQEIIDEAVEEGYSNDMRKAVMQEEEYGGHFGGASKKKTQKTNEVINTSLRTTEQVATGVMQMQGQEQVNHVQNGTQTATEAQGKLFEIAGSQFTLQSVAEYIGSGFQAWRSYKHGQSAGKVKDRGKTESERVAADIKKLQDVKATLTSPNDAPEIERINHEIERLQGEIRNNVSGNQDREVEAQQTEAGTQALVALGTGVSATLKVITASRLQDAAKNMQNPNYYGLNTGGSIVNDGSIDPALTSTPSSDALIDPAMLEDASHAGNTPLLDLNPDTTLRDPPIPAMNMAGMPQNPGGSGGGGAGSAGGTSRAQDESSGNQAQTRDPKAGTYAASEGGGKYASRGASSSNGPGVKVDSAFADLLKKFLPGSDDKKDKPMLDLNANRDRSPASNQAAVIGRNKNIFDEIHKRYQKKNAEGAVIF